MSRTASRIRHLLAANFNALLEKAEDPEKMMRALVREMDDTREELGVARTDLREELGVAEREAGRYRRRIAHWQGQAEAALGEGDEDRARQAIAQRQEAEQASRRLSEKVDEMQAGLQRVDDDLARLERRQVQARRLCEAVAQHGHESAVAARYATPADECLSRSRERLDRVERRLERLEARVAAYDVAPAPPAAMPALSHAVDEELAAMKARVHAQDAADSAD